MSTYQMPPHDAEASSWRPLFIHEIRNLAESDGLMHATRTILARDNVTLVADGHLHTIENHEDGMLFVGNHDKQFEFVALMSVLSQLGRTSMKNIVKFYVEDQVRWALGSVGTDIVLPVYPRLLATDRKNKLNLELGSRVVFNRSLKTTAESKRLTSKSLLAASEELSQGGIVNIFPCGSIVNSMRKPWRQGVGHIINQLGKEARDSVLVIPYRADNINRARLLAAVISRGRGICGSPQNITVEFGQPKTATEIVSALPREFQCDPKAITGELQQHYRTSFRS